MLSFRLLPIAVLSASCWITDVRAADQPAIEAVVADAAQQGLQEQVAQLLKAGADPNAAQVDGTTALHWAAYRDEFALAKLLLEAGADAGQANRYTVTPLTLACINGNGPLVERLLDAGADPQTTLPGGETALMTAARTGRVEPVQHLLKHGAKVNAREKKGQTALMWAAADGHVEVVDALLKAGADFRTPLKSGFTPLFFAARSGREDVVMRLLAEGDDVNGTMQPERTFGNGPRNGTTPLIMAVENGHFDLAIHLVEAGADPNDQRCGFTALHVISWVRKPNRGDGHDGDPPPIGSGRMSSLQFVRELVERGADVNRKLKRGRSGRGRLGHTGATPFLMAADTADVQLMRLLIELGADPLLPNADGATPLMAAAGLGTLAPGEEAGSEEEALAAVELLLELGADINTVDRNGETAMHGAAYKNLPKMVHLLEKRGADIAIWNRKNRYGWSPLVIAEGHRPGNYKPSVATVAAIHEVMRANGISPPPPTPRPENNDNYAKQRPPAKQPNPSPQQKGPQ